MLNLRLLYASLTRVEEHKVDGVLVSTEEDSVRLQANILSEIESFLRIRDKLEKQRLREFNKVMDCSRAVESKLGSLKNTNFLELSASEMRPAEVEFLLNYKCYQSLMRELRAEERETQEELATLRGLLGP